MRKGNVTQEVKKVRNKKLSSLVSPVSCESPEDVKQNLLWNNKKLYVYSKQAGT